MQLAVFGAAGITSDALVLVEGSGYHAFAINVPLIAPGGRAATGTAHRATSPGYRFVELAGREQLAPAGLGCVCSVPWLMLMILLALISRS